MAKPTIAVSIAATDQFSANMARFRKKLATLDAPLKKLRTATSGGPDVNFMDTVGNGFRDFAKRTAGVRSALSSLSPSFATLASATTVGGVVAMANSFAQAGVTLENTSKLAGMSAGQLHTLQGAARMMGLSADTADTAMLGLNSALQGAAYNKNPQAAALFRRFNIDFGDFERGATSAASALPGVVRALSSLYKINPSAAASLAQGWTMNPDALGLLARGMDELQQKMQAAAASAPWTPENEQAARDYAASFGAATNAAENLRNVLVTRLAPGATEVMNEFTNWIATTNQIERSLAAAEKVAHGFAAVMDAIRATGHFLGADRLVPAAVAGLSGDRPWWQKALVPLDFRAGPSSQAAPSGGGSSGGQPDRGASIGQVTPGTFSDKAGGVVNRLMSDFGLTRDQAAGAVGNLGHESGLAGINERHPLVPGSRGGFGWAQWTGPRRQAFEAFAQRHGLDPASDEANYQFLREELQNTPYGRAAIARLKAATSPADAARQFFPFESGGDPRAIPAMGDRERLAIEASRLAERGSTPAPKPPLPAGAPPIEIDPRAVPTSFNPGSNMPTPGTTPPVKVDVTIDHRNAPDGVTASGSVRGDVDEAMVTLKRLEAVPAVPRWW